MNNDDGKIIIGTEIDAKGIKKDLVELSKELEQYDKEAQELLQQKAELQVDTSQLDDLQEKLKEAKALVNELDSKKVLKVDSRGYEYYEWAEGYEDAIKNMGEIETQIINIQQAQKDVQPELDIINNKLEENKNHQKEIKKEYGEELAILKQITEEEQEQRRQEQEEKAREKQVASLTSKFKHMGLALLGVGSVYGLVRKAARSWLSEHQETANAFKQVWANIMEFIAPYIEKVANWLMKMIGYLNVFIKAVTGGKLDLSKNMNKNKKAVEGTTKAMKGLNKEMASFDEATKLHDNSSIDSGGGILDDDDKIDDIFNEENLNKNITDTLTKAGELINKHSGKIGTAAGVVLGGAILSKVGSALLGGSGATAGGVAGGYLGGAGLAGVAGSIATALLVGLGAFSLGAIGYTGYKVGKAGLETTEQNKDLEKMQVHTKKSVALYRKLDKQTSENTKGSKEIATATAFYNNKIKDNIELMGGSLRTIDELGFFTKSFNQILEGENSIVDTNNRIISKNAVELKKWIENQENLRLSGKMTKEQEEEYRKTLLNSMYVLQSYRNEIGYLPDDMESVYRVLDRTIDKIDTNTIDWYNLTDAIKVYNAQKVNDKTIKITTAVSGAVEDFTTLGKNLATSIILGMKAKLAVGTAGNAVADAFKNAFKLASGGIINLPGSGVPVGSNAVAGERGAEGIIPLTDSQAMETLGEAIGRYVTINANIVNTMNGRVISRELQKLDNENTFMNNR